MNSWLPLGVDGNLHRFELEIVNRAFGARDGSTGVALAEETRLLSNLLHLQLSDLLLACGDGERAMAAFAGSTDVHNST